MPAETTKKKILTAALKLFNERGFANVRLQHIADESVYSLGHQAYHFKNKEAILFALYTELAEKQQTLLSEFRIVPLFTTIDYQICATFRLQHEYLFFYQDTLELVRAFPAISRAYQEYLQRQTLQIRMALDFNIARGALKAETSPNFYNMLAEQFLMTEEFWILQQKIKGLPIDDQEKYVTTLWNLLLPQFTHIGQREYEQMKIVYE